jgi:hypothetical protein
MASVNAIALRALRHPEGGAQRYSCAASFGICGDDGRAHHTEEWIVSEIQIDKRH